MDKGPDAFRTISEVADDLDIPQHVLRFWETRFTQIKPLKRGGGRRYYRPDDVELIRGIRHLLYGEGYTIRGVQRILKDEGIRFVQAAWRDGARVPAPQPGDRDDDAFLQPAQRGEFAPQPGIDPPAPGQGLLAQAGLDDLWEAGSSLQASQGESIAVADGQTRPWPSPGFEAAPDFGMAQQGVPRPAPRLDGSPGAPIREGLTRQDLSRTGRQYLEAVLADLQECRRLLELARRDDAG